LIQYVPNIFTSTRYSIDRTNRTLQNTAYRTTSMAATKSKSKKHQHPIYLCHRLFLLLGIFGFLTVAMVSAAEASTSTSASSHAVGEWKIKEVWKEDDAGALSIAGEGRDYVLKLLPRDNDTNNHKILTLSVKVGNAMSSMVEILDREIEREVEHETDKIKVGFVMSTRMMAGSEEKRHLENYLSNQLPNMVSMEVRVDGEEKMLVLSSEGSARIVCEPSEASQD